MLLSNGSLGIFYANGLVGTLMTVALLLLTWSFVGRAGKKEIAGHRHRCLRKRARAMA